MTTPITVFAYGSNLDERQMLDRCPSAVVEARASLANHALVFGGYSVRWDSAVASLARVKGARVDGVLYRISPEDLTRLDRFEGNPFAYERRQKLVVDEHGRRRRAQVYLQPAEALERWTPGDRYFRVLWRAYGRLGFDQAALVAAAGGAA
jgi:gamma-glutamylcyclotransferase